MKSGRISTNHHPHAVEPYRAILDHAAVSDMDDVPARSLAHASPAPAVVRSSIILPAYNEAIALPVVLDGLFSVIDDSCEVIVVDDGSSDRTVAIASSYPCRVICHLYNQGKGAAVQTGLNAARGKSIIIMDADDTYPANAIPQLIELLEEYDFVRGIRLADKSSMPAVNRLGNVVFDLVLKTMHGLEGSDHLSGLYGLRHEALQAIHIDSDGFDLEVEIGIKVRALRMKTASFPINYQPRLGDKKLNAYKDGWRILSRIFSLTLLYNPKLMFIGPGVLIWALAMGLALLLSQGPALTPFLGVDISAFIVAALGVATGFQLIVFGIAASLYAVELGALPSRWLTRLSNQRVRFGTALFGLGMSSFGGALLIVNVVEGLISAIDGLYLSRSTVLAVALISCGLQVILAPLFISIFAGRIEKQARNASKRQAHIAMGASSGMEPGPLPAVRLEQAAGDIS